ncbi:MAG: Regulatory protein AtoC [Thermoanaerobaculia bacterium]|nr:Regulatory protein AtoC [Thermoanaerobaculia bacterium]
MAQPRRVLLIDDDPFARQVVVRMLKPEGWTIVEADTIERATAALSENPDPNVILLDIILGEENGLDFLEAYRSAGGQVPVLVITSMDDVNTAVAAMKAGAYDFLVKPLSIERLTTALANAAEKAQLVRENITLRRRVRQESFSRFLVGESRAMMKLREEMEKVVESDIPVCLLGETGTGKELVARWLHENGPRSKGPFVDLNCAAIPETLIESELFGHEKGAFTNAIVRHRGKLEQADGGTLLLDELGEMAAATQARLLRVLQERTLNRVGGAERIPFDLRLISATQRDLNELVREGKFREDLYFRVVVYPIRLPPLRDRKDDLSLLVHHFIRKFRERTGRPVEGITPEALVKLEAHDWPGNVRELENAVFRAVVAARGPFLTSVDFPDVEPSGVPRFGPRPYLPKDEGIQGFPPPQPAPPSSGVPIPSNLPRNPVTMEDYERAAILLALEAENGNIKAAADRLEMARSTLYRRIKALNIPVPD